MREECVGGGGREKIGGKLRPPSLPLSSSEEDSGEASKSSILRTLL